MGTHPIFESAFDCLTEKMVKSHIHFWVSSPRATSLVLTNQSIWSCWTFHLPKLLLVVSVWNFRICWKRMPKFSKLKANFWTLLPRRLSKFLLLVIQPTPMPLSPQHALHLSQKKTSPPLPDLTKTELLHKLQ